jgi:hypothetical protein
MAIPKAFHTSTVSLGIWADRLLVAALLAEDGARVGHADGLFKTKSSVGYGV